jgi:hypothetical protein
MSNLEASNVIVLERPASQSEEQMDNQFLRKLAEQVRNHSRSSTKSIIAIGEALRDAKKHLEHGKFVEWVIAECGFTIRTAQNYMRAAELTDKSETVSLLNPAALYRLAKASTPPDVVDRVVEMLETGTVPTEQEIIELIRKASQKETEGAAVPEMADDQATLRLARELHTRLGHELVLQLIESRWSELCKHLRSAIEQPCCADAEENSYLEAASSPMQTQQSNTAET